MNTLKKSPRAGRRFRASVRAPRLTLLFILALSCCAPALARQTTQAGGLAAAATPVRAEKLPSPEKVVGDYVKAVGGKKRLAALRDATYEWAVEQGGADAGTARTHVKAPSSSRTDIHAAGVETNMAANARSAWVRGREGILRTLTDREALAAKLHATLDATHLVDYKKQKVLARTAALEQLDGDAVYAVEFSTRAGARIRHYFGATSKLLVKTWDEARGLTLRYADYRAASGEQVLEPHRVTLEREGAETLTLVLRGARYNTSLSDSLFDPPGDSGLDVPALLRELARNQVEVDKRVNDYTFNYKETQRKVNDRGEVTKETVTVREVYPFAGYGWVTKLVSENGMPLTSERAAKEEKRVAEALAKAEREAPKGLQRREAERAKRAEKRRKESEGGAGGADEDDDVGISMFLRACEFVSPRRERFRDRDTVVFDFRPRPGFRPSNQGETIVSKLAGTIWVDPADRQVMRLEGRLVESFKMGGGLVASVKPGSAFVFEQTRLDDGVWLPRFSQINASAKIFLFAGMSINETTEFTDFKRFSTKSGDAILDAPKKP